MINADAGREELLMEAIVKKTEKPLLERFERYVAKGPYCWNWIGIKNQKGYGRFRLDDRLVTVHRFALQQSGVDIPPNMFVDHICRNRACVNPQHLRVVTPYVNSMENSDGVGALNARKTHCPKGHPLDGIAKFNGQRICKTCKRQTVRRRRAEGKCG